MSQSRLNDSLSSLHLFDEAMSIGQQFVVDVADVSGNDRPEEETPESRSRIGRKNHVSERDPTRRGQWSRVPDLQFSEEHAAS